MSGSRRRVLLVYCGGTMGMLPKDPRNPASPLVPRPFAESVAHVPGLEQEIRGLEGGLDFDIERDVLSIDPPIDSAAVRPGLWTELARMVRERIEEYDGFVVLHGTDTMAYTASALAFLFENLPRPVVLTGSQVPLFRSPSDARDNLLNAVQVAAHAAPTIPLVPEVLLVFGDRVLRGCRATKVSASARNAFASLNEEPLGTIEPGRIRIHRDRVRPAPDPELRPFSVNEAMFDERSLRSRIITIELTPDLHLDDVELLLRLPDVVGVILHSYGAGNVPPDPELHQLLLGASAAGCIILNVTQCLHGQVQMGRYASSSELLEYGVVSGMDMTDETARIKIYWALATQRSEDRAAQMQISQRGEQTEDLFNLRFGEPREEAAQAHSESSRPDPPFRPEDLRRAVVRLAGARFERRGAPGAAPDFPCAYVFLGDAPTRGALDHAAPGCIARLAGQWEAPGEMLVADVTERLQAEWLARAVPGTEPIRLSVVCPSGVAVRYRGLFLALFARARS